MTGTYSVGTVVKAVTSANGAPLLVKNTGAAAVVIGSDQGLLQSWTLGAGSSMQWAPDKALYARTQSTVAGTASTLDVLDNGGGQIFDAGAIAGQILGQGLAGDIANAILSAGVQIIDQPAVLDYQPYLAGHGPGGIRWFGGGSGTYYDTSRYQSLMFQALSDAGLPLAPTGTGWRLYLSWAVGTSTFTQVIRTHDVGGYNLLRFPVLGSSVAVGYSNDTTVARGTQMQLTASTRPVSKIDYNPDYQQTANFGWLLTYGPRVSEGHIARSNVPVSTGSTVLYIPQRAGRVLLRTEVTAGGSTGQLFHVLAVGHPGSYDTAIHAFGVDGGKLFNQSEFILPESPCNIFCATTGGATNQSFSLTWL